MKTFFSIIIILFATLSAFFIADYANNLQLNIYNFINIPPTYSLVFKISKISSAIVPFSIAVFLLISTKIMLTEFYDYNITTKQLFQTVGLSFTPMLLYYYFFWYNLIRYCNTDNINNVEDFNKMTFMLNMGLYEFSIINYICWLCMYICMIIILVKNKITTLNATISVFFPSGLVVLIYYIISNFVD